MPPVCTKSPATMTTSLRGIRGDMPAPMVEAVSTASLEAAGSGAGMWRRSIVAPDDVATARPIVVFVRAFSNVASRAWIGVKLSESAANELGEVEVTVVMPCLDEADTVVVCVEKARRALREAGIQGEVIVADNGSKDGSRELAAGAGARVVPVADRGYGNALMEGIAAARGRYVIMGDADDSYDFLE